MPRVDASQGQAWRARTASLGISPVAASVTVALAGTRRHRGRDLLERACMKLTRSLPRSL